MDTKYEPPRLTVLGRVEDLTLTTGCQPRGANGYKAVGGADLQLAQGLHSCSP